MTTEKPRDSRAGSDAGLGMEAAEWLQRLNAAQETPAAADREAINAGFLEWVATSPDHLRVFFETMEIHQRLPQMDFEQLATVEELLAPRFADVIPLPGSAGLEARLRRAQNKNVPAARRARQRMFAAVAASVLCVASAGYWLASRADRFSTGVGEQRSTKLEDGSFIYMNTDSRIEVDFSEHTRNVRLVRGEALFVVERNTARPFIVTAGDTTVRAVGTQFNVRRRAEGADVAVVEGVVQVSSLDAPKRLAAGEQAHVEQGRVIARARAPASDPVAWRQRRLVFHDARLADVAEEFNRYNRTKIRIEGSAAREIQLSGIFDADRPQALMLYAAKNDALAVEPEGNDWVIRGR